MLSHIGIVQEELISQLLNGHCGSYPQLKEASLHHQGDVPLEILDQAIKKFVRKVAQDPKSTQKDPIFLEKENSSVGMAQSIFLLEIEHLWKELKIKTWGRHHKDS